MRHNLVLAILLSASLPTGADRIVLDPVPVRRRGHCPDCDEPTIQNATLTEHYCGTCRVVVAQPVFR